MLAVFSLCEEKGACFSSNEKIFKILSKKTKITPNEIENILDVLCQDEYIDIVKSDCNKLYCIVLMQKGKAFKRSMVNFRKELLFRALLTVALAFLSILITTIIKKIIG